VFTPFHKPPYSYLYGRSVDETTTGYALVLNPIVFSKTRTCRFSRVLMDGGNSINLLYRTSMEKLGIPAI
jgi:hypothetical protein